MNWRVPLEVISEFVEALKESSSGCLRHGVLHSVEAHPPAAHKNEVEIGDESHLLYHLHELQRLGFVVATPLLHHRCAVEFVVGVN